MGYPICSCANMQPQPGTMQLMAFSHAFGTVERSFTKENCSGKSHANCRNSKHMPLCKVFFESLR